MLNLTEVQPILFIILSTVTVGSAILVVINKNPVASAVFLVLTFFALAGIYALMNAIFIATMQVLVYAGAIMVLVVFVLMLLSLREETHQEIWSNPPKKTLILLIVFSFAFLLLASLRTTKEAEPTVITNITSPNYEYKLKDTEESKVIVSGNTASVGASTFIDYLLPFEIISILLLVAVIGAVIIAKKDSVAKS
ncbi:MAG TPA: NADH-quinone oxidoreductase subunit J [Leptospiraceae bacterium]|nr:NADH-quinone oxidoreductase subunit J [Leptospiraceae bacterium]HMW05281.1 NADH-quinone oxidoreductase subunit J [Leptospiraceae bacterium]HMX33654.1 NADH-quinone oxidoreductase subunit J [Leptospiraceae bacterium]HMY31477.1 NADH-quinone oxidoreductase subunit J [Leptospiraceae bacterium]HMZ66016.1 NADH-quinone oxidoreductase subunit J [Leptospiraceae bacterium]